jgi:hypothetical protein
MREACVLGEYKAFCILNGKNLKVGTKVLGLTREVDGLNASGKAKTIECQQYRIAKRAKGYHKRVMWWFINRFYHGLSAYVQESDATNSGEAKSTGRRRATGVPYRPGSATLTTYFVSRL